MLIDQSIRHFGTLLHFVRHYGIRHAGTNPLVESVESAIRRWGMVSFAKEDVRNGTIVGVVAWVKESYASLGVRIKNGGVKSVRRRSLRKT